MNCVGMCVSGIITCISFFQYENMTCSIADDIWYTARKCSCFCISFILHFCTH